MSQKDFKRGIDKEAFFNDPAYRRQVERVINFERIFRRIALIVLPLFLAGFTYYLYTCTQDLPSLEELENPKPDLSSIVYSEDGEVLHRYFMINRRLVDPHDISPYVSQALLATEDRRFYDHWGMDLVRLFKAIYVNILTFSLEEGASTLTQQLSRNLYLNSREKTVTRKIRELFTALQIERTYTKNEILNMYLNVVYFGSGAYGIQAASQTFFNKNAKDLSADEAALLVGALKSPFGYSPVFNQDRSVARRNLILYNMKETGYLSESEYEAARSRPITTEFTSITDMGQAPYFTEFIRQRLQEDGKQYNFDLYRDGLNIYTTINSRMQDIANQVIIEHLDSIQVHFNETYDWKAESEAIDLLVKETTPYANAMLRKENPAKVLASLRADSTFMDSLMTQKMEIQAGFVVLDPKTGYIRAWVGGRDFETVKFDHVIQAKRQPGSSFKPIIYSVAIDNGYPPTYQLLNQPIVMQDETLKGQWWTPKNSGGEFGGLTTLRDAIRQSLNLITIRMVIEIAKPSQVVDYAKRMGIHSKLQAVPSIALGSNEVNVLELTSAYGTIANEGLHIEPTGLLKVEDNNGNLIFEEISSQQEAFSRETAYIMTSLMSAVVDSGTGASIRFRYQFMHKAAGKTGTTNDQGDAWFVGFTPELVAGVWVGFDDRRIHYTNMSHGQGARAALPAWALFMKKVYDDPVLKLQKGNWIKPPGIFELAVCKESLKAATEFCTDTYIEVFTKRSVPDQCDIHTTEGEKGKTSKKKRNIGF